MLAQNFKTARQLKISRKTYDALKVTLDAFETGKIVHRNLRNAYAVEGYDSDGSKPKKFGFNMSDWHTHYECGTVCCIGGAAELFSGITIREREDPNLYVLFYPNDIIVWERVSVAQAAIALRNYLRDGTANWRSFIPKSNLYKAYKD